MSVSSRLKALVTAPVRFIRYVNQPSTEARARYDALSEREKAERRHESLKRAGFYRVFPSPFGSRRRSRR